MKAPSCVFRRNLVGTLRRSERSSPADPAPRAHRTRVRICRASDRGFRTVPPQARRSCASDLTPGAGYRRFPGPAGGLELQGGGGDGLEGDRLGLDADRGWRGRRPGPPPRKVAPRSRSPAGRREPARGLRPVRSPGRARLTGESGQAATRARFHDACAARRAAMADAPSAPGRRNVPSDRQQIGSPGDQFAGTRRSSARPATPVFPGAAG